MKIQFLKQYLYVIIFLCICGFVFSEYSKLFIGLMVVVLATGCLKALSVKYIKSKSQKIIITILLIILASTMIFLKTIYYPIQEKYGANIHNERFFVCQSVKKVLVSNGYCKDITNCDERFVWCNNTDNVINIVIHTDKNNISTQIIDTLKAQKQKDSSVYELYFLKDSSNTSNMAWEEVLKRVSFKVEIKSE